MKLSIKKVFHCSVKKMRTKEKFHFLDIPAFLPLGPIIQKPFPLFWQNLKWPKIFICLFKKGLTFGLGKLLPFEILMAKEYKILFAISSFAIIEKWLQVALIVTPFYAN